LASADSSAPPPLKSAGAPLSAAEKDIIPSRDVSQVNAADASEDIAASRDIAGESEISSQDKPVRETRAGVTAEEGGVSGEGESSDD
jgi:hypothetical protein